MHQYIFLSLATYIVATVTLTVTTCVVRKIC